MSKDELDNYFKSIKLLFPIYSKKEKQFLNDFKNTVLDFTERDPSCTMEDVLDRFSAPEDVVRDYLAEAMQDENFCKRISSCRILKKAVAVLLVLAALSAAIWGTFCYKAYLDSKNSVITEKVIVIE